MTNHTQSSWFVLVTGIVALVVSIVFVSGEAVPTSSDPADTASVSLSRSAVWQRRIEALQSNSEGGAANYDLTVEGSNPTGTN